MSCSCFCSVLFCSFLFSSLLLFFCSPFFYCILLSPFFYSRRSLRFFQVTALLFCCLFTFIDSCVLLRQKNRIKTIIICSTFRAVSSVRTCCLPQKIIRILEHSRKAKKRFRFSVIRISRFSNSIPVLFSAI